MFPTIIELLIRLSGGFWTIRNKINGTPNEMYRRFLMIIYYLYLRNLSSYIGHTVVFVDEPLFPHGLKGIFIAGGSKIGKNCIIFQHVTIGGNPLPDSKTTGFPTIGNNCYLGAGSIVIGDVVIGDNCRIGANCTVYEDIPANCVVLPQAPRIIQREKIVNKHYKWSPKGPVYYDDGKWVLETDLETIGNLHNKL